MRDDWARARQALRGAAMLKRSTTAMTLNRKNKSFASRPVTLANLDEDMVSSI
jgi:hypothetical protein